MRPAWRSSHGPIDPPSGRLALFYAAVALGFGNHLSMVLLLPAFTLFLLMHRRPGAGDPLQPRLVLMAVAIAALGALQYAWNFRGLWTELEPPASIGEAVAKFWFDVTKADWRETLVMTVSESGLESRPAMYWFDLRQQFGVPGVVLAAIGFFYVLWRWPRRAILLLVLYAANLAFAWTYNVGDAYIFFLPSHYAVALWAGAGTAAIAALTATHVQSHDRRSRESRCCCSIRVARIRHVSGAGSKLGQSRGAIARRVHFAGIGDFRTRPQDAVLGLDANWQVQNAVEYYMRERKPELVWFVTEHLEWLEEGDRLRRFGDFVAANAEIGRSAIVTERVADSVMPDRRPARWFHDGDPHFAAVSARHRIDSARYAIRPRSSAIGSGIHAQHASVSLMHGSGSRQA